MDAQLKEYREKQNEKYKKAPHVKSTIKSKRTIQPSYDTSDDSSDDSSDYSYDDSDDYDESSEDDTSIQIVIKSKKSIKVDTTKPVAISKPKNRKKNIPSTIRRLVWNKYIGEHIGKHKCYCCRLTDITQLSFHCGHIVSEQDGGKIEVDNLRPICQNCNSSMRCNNMNDFIESYNLHK
jgi:hypothetical protein